MQISKQLMACSAETMLGCSWKDLPLTEPCLSPAGPEQGLGLQCCRLNHLKLMFQPSKSDHSMSATQSSLRDACKGNWDTRYVDQAWYHGKSERTGLKGLPWWQACESVESFLTFERYVTLLNVT